jgi:hypothetical protein
MATLFRVEFMASKGNFYKKLLFSVLFITFFGSLFSFGVEGTTFFPGSGNFTH